MNVEVRPRPRIEDIRSAGPDSGRGRGILWADPGEYPGVPTMDPRLTLGLHKLTQLGSAAVLLTPEGQDAVRDHFQHVIRTQRRVHAVTTPTWNTSEGVFKQVGGHPDLPSWATAESVTKLGVEITRQALDAEGSDAMLLLSARPTGNTLNGAGTLEPDEIKRRLRNQFNWLLDATGDRRSDSLLMLETETTLPGAQAAAEVAEELDHPYIITFRPNNRGRSSDRSSWADISDAIAGDNLVGGGFTCQRVDVIDLAMGLAREQGADSLTMIAMPNGAQGHNESIEGGLTEAQVAQIEQENVIGLIQIHETYGTSFFGGCCNSTAENLANWQKAFEERDVVQNGSRQRLWVPSGIIV